MKYYLMSAGAIFATLGLFDVPDSWLTSVVCLLLALILEAFDHGKASCAG